MRKLFVFTTLILSAGASMLKADDTPLKKNPEPAELKIPFQLMTSGHFVVVVKINDKGPYNLIFDTGAPTNLVNNRLAMDSGLIPKKDNPPKGLMGLGGQVKIKQLMIGDAKAENISAMVIDHPTVKAFSDAFEKKVGPIDGIVGFPFFARYAMTVDYQKKELTLIPNSYQPQDVMSKMMGRLMNPDKDGGKAKVVGASAYWGLVVDKDAKDEEAGVNITEVMEGAPADKAGLKKGDRLLTIDSRWTDSAADTIKAVAEMKGGKAVLVVIRRGGKEMTLSVTPGKGL